MLELQTVNDVFERVIGRGSATVAQAQIKGEWTPISGQQMYGRVRALAETLKGWGVGRGDRVALVSENRWEWAVSDFAVLAIGAVDVPLYQTLTPEQVGFMLRDSGSKVAIVSTRSQFEKIVAAGDLPALEHVVVMESGQFENAESFAALMERAPEMEARDAAFDAMLKETKPEELATIVYTSGTTGDPKGVMLTHRNLADNLRHSTDDLQISDRDSSISFLPLSHALARHLDYALYTHGAVISYLPRFDDLPKVMTALKPSVFLAVPRVFEKVRQAVEGRSSHGLKKAIFQWAMRQGAKRREQVKRGETPGALGWKLANKLVYSKIREAFGGNAKVFISGGAPLGKETAEWFLDVGIRIFEGYGLTETSPVISRNTFKDYRLGSVGKTIPNIEVRVAADGELEVRGSSVFAGYWRNEEATKKEFTEDGWFKTGDVSKLEDGFLTITDRKKELLKTSGGKYIAPQPVESKLKSDALVGQAALIGDNRKYPAVLISPNFQALESWAQKNGVDAKDRGNLVQHEKVQKVYQSIIQRVNGGLAHYEQIKRVGVVPDEWTPEGGELTPSMKLKRRVINEKYKAQIDGLYRE